MGERARSCFFLINQSGHSNETRNLFLLCNLMRKLWIIPSPAEVENQCSKSEKFQFISPFFLSFWLPQHPTPSHVYSMCQLTTLLRPLRSQVNLFTFNSSGGLPMHEIEIKYQLFNHLLSIVSQLNILQPRTFLSPSSSQTQFYCPCVHVSYTSCRHSGTFSEPGNRALQSRPW